jgi:hypothetical protein
MEPIFTLGAVAQRLGWTMPKLRYRLSKAQHIEDLRIQQGSHSVRVMRLQDVEELAKTEQDSRR